MSGQQPPASSGIDLTGIPVDTTAPVLVTGATGYLGSWVVKGLVDAGATVHAAVRDPEATSKVAHLKRAAEQAPGTLKLFAADLLQPGSYDEAMAGCGVVIHTASPFVRNVDDPQRDLVDPALEGTRNVLDGIGRTPSVRRVVLTSSIAAMFGDAADIENYRADPDRGLLEHHLLPGPRAILLLQDAGGAGGVAARRGPGAVGPGGHQPGLHPRPGPGPRPDQRELHGRADADRRHHPHGRPRVG